MIFAVTELRCRGVRLTREEVAAAVTHCGNLVLQDVELARSKGRAMMAAELFRDGRSATPYALLTCLFEPVLIQMKANWFVLSGWQLDSAGPARVTTQYRQEWLVRQSSKDLEATYDAWVSARAAQVHQFGVDGMGK